MNSAALTLFRGKDMYSVRSVFGDCGVYRNDELIVICNS